MDELNPSQIERLQATATVGDQVREFCRHPGFKLYMKELEAIINDDKQKWLQGTDEEAKLARLEARGVQKAIDVLKKFILSGDRAKHMLKEVSEVTVLNSPQS